MSVHAPPHTYAAHGHSAVSVGLNDQSVQPTVERTCAYINTGLQISERATQTGGAVCCTIVNVLLVRGPTCTAWHSPSGAMGVEAMSAWGAPCSPLLSAASCNGENCRFFELVGTGDLAGVLVGDLVGEVAEVFAGAFPGDLIGERVGEALADRKGTFTGLVDATRTPCGK